MDITHFKETVINIPPEDNTVASKCIVNDLSVDIIK
jgi:hypothetical protein